MHNERKLWFSGDLQCHKFNSCWIRAEWERRLDGTGFQWWPINGRLSQELATLETIRGLEPKCVSQLILGSLPGKRRHWPIFFYLSLENLPQFTRPSLVCFIPSRFFNGEYMHISLLHNSVNVPSRCTSIDDSYVFEISPSLLAKVRLIQEKTERQISLIENMTCTKSKTSLFGKKQSTNLIIYGLI